MQNLVLITQVAFSMVSPIFLGLLIGRWLDNKLGFKMLFSLIFIILGVLAGFLNVYKLLTATDKNKKGEDQSGRKQ